MQKQQIYAVQQSPVMLFSSRALSILLAEDDPVVQKFVRLFLERAGHSVTPVSDGNQAYRFWEQGDYDLILMDIQMPGMYGDEVTQKIRQQEQEQHIPIIAVTANSYPQGRKNLIDAGFDGYVAKPFQFDDLLAEIEHVVSRFLL